MQDFNKEIERIKANGGQVVGGFTGAVPPEDIFTLEEGDTFTIPEDFKVCEDARREGAQRAAQFTLVEATAKNGEEKLVRIYPAFFSKNRAVVDQYSGVATGVREKSDGEAVEEYRKYATVQEAMEGISKRAIVVSEKRTAWVENRYSTDGKPSQTPFFTLDFVQQNTKKGKK